MTQKQADQIMEMQDELSLLSIRANKAINNLQTIQQDLMDDDEVENGEAISAIVATCEHLEGVEMAANQLNDIEFPESDDAE